MKPRRPAGITVLAVAYFLVAGLFLLAALLGTAPRRGPTAPDEAARQLQKVIMLGAAGVAAAVAFGLWRLQKWTRTLLTIFAAGGIPLSLVTLVVSLVRLDFRKAIIQFVFGVALNAWILVYMLLPHVKQAFLAARK